MKGLYQRYGRCYEFNLRTYTSGLKSVVWRWVWVDDLVELIAPSAAVCSFLARFGL